MSALHRSGAFRLCGYRAAIKLSFGAFRETSKGVGSRSLSGGFVGVKGV